MVRKAGPAKRHTTHGFRRWFAAYLVPNRCDIRRMEELVGHKDVGTTMIYTYVLNRGGRGVRSPVDTLASPEIAGDRLKQPMTPRTPDGQCKRPTGDQLLPKHPCALDCNHAAHS